MALFARRKTSIDLSKKSTSFVDIAREGGLKFIGVCVLVISLLLALHYYRVANDLRGIAVTTPTPSDNTDPVTQVILSVEKHMLLPQGEHPQVAKVSDLSALSNIPFFGNALVGDQVLVYCKTSLSILYSPSRDRVIEVSRVPVAGSCPAK